MTYAELWRLAEELFPRQTFALNVEGWNRIRRHKGASEIAREVRWALWLSEGSEELEGPTADALAAELRAYVAKQAMGEHGTPESVEACEVPS